MRTRPPTLERLETRVTPATASVVKDVLPGPSGSGPSNLTAVGGTLYFDAGASQNSVNLGLTSLWKSDGTPQGTVSLGQFTVSNQPTGFTPFNGKVYFVVGNNLGVTDGTTAGTVTLTHFAPNPNGYTSPPPVAFGGSLYFTDTTTLYKSDGTAAGTTPVATFDVGSVATLTPEQLPGQPALLYFSAADSSHNFGLYQTDGTAAGTTLIESFGANGRVNAITQLGPALYFSVGNFYNGSSALGLWKSDGTAAGTTQLTNTQTELGPVLNGKLFFVAGNDSPMVWETDGTSAGTVPVPGGPSVYGFGQNPFVPFGNALYFTSYDYTGAQLWRTDGTAAGTAQVTKIPGGGVGGVAVVGTGPADGAIYFLNTNGTNPALGAYGAPVLYQTNGTTAGIKFVRRFGPNAYNVIDLTAVGSTLFFAASAPALGQELWKVTPTPKAQLVAVGAGAGSTPRVRVYDAATGKLKFTLLAAPTGFRGGVRVAVGDVNGDGTDDVVTGAGPGGGPVVKVFDGRTGQLLRSFYAYVRAFTGGVYVAAGDLNNDGSADVITGTGAGGGPHVEAFDGLTGQVIRSFFAYASNFAGGVTVAAGNVDGTEDIITGAGPGGTPLVRVFDGLTSARVQSFYAFPATFAGGVTVASADENGDGVADVVAGAGAGYAGGPAVAVYSGVDDKLLLSFTAYDPHFGGGVRVAAADFTGTGAGSILTGPGAPAGSDVRVLGHGVPAALVRFNAFDPTFLGGVWVA
jgi:ELWxxDGT repeat protein